MGLLSRSFLFGVLTFASPVFAASNVPQTFTLDGQLYMTGSTAPLVDANATVTIQILDSQSKCILYEETQTAIDTRPSGYFNLQVGSNTGASKRSGSDPGNTMAQIFQNNATIAAVSAPGQTCTIPFAPASSENRVFRLIVTPSGTGTPDTLAPDIVMDSVPNAMVAETLQGYSPASFLLANTTAPAALSQANLQNVFSTTNYPILTSLLTNGTNGYVQKVANGTVSLPAVSGVPSSPVAGQIWYDSGTIKYYDGSNPQVLGVSGAGVTNLGIGTGLTPQGTISAGGSTISVDVGISTGQIVQVQSGNKLPALDGSNLTNLKDTAISGNLSVTSINTSGNATVGAVLTSGEVWTNKLKLFDGANSIEFAAPTLSSSTSFTLPATRPGVSGYVLSSDTSGVMTWVAQTPVGLSAVSNTATLAQDKIWIGDSGGKAQEKALSGDVSLVANGTATVTGLRGKTVSATLPTASGQVLRYDGANWTPNFISMFDLRSTVTGSAAFGGVGCLSNQTLTWTSATDNLACSNISLPASQITGVLPVANGGTGTTSLSGIFLINGGQNGAVSAGTNDANDLTLKSNGLARVTVTSGGNVGIGTTNPGQPLDVIGAGRFSGVLSSTNFAVYASGGSPLAANIYAPVSNTLAFGTNSTERVRIDSSGDVGIGTANPQLPLHVYQPTAATSAMILDGANNYPGLSLRVAGTEYGRITQEITGNVYIDAQDDIWLRPDQIAGGQTGSVIIPSGNVGIGTASPGTALDIVGSLVGGTISLSDSVTNTTAKHAGVTVRHYTNTEKPLGVFYGATTSTTSRLMIGGGHPNYNAATSIEFYTGATNTTSAGTMNMLIDGSGNVGIGTTTPTATLDVNGTIKATGFSGPMTPTSSAVGAGTNGAPSMTFSGDPDTGFYDTSSNNTISVAVGGSKIFDFTSAGLVSPTSGGASVGTGVGTTGAPTFSFAGDTDTGWWHPAADTLAASTAGTERIRITSTGNVGIGTSAAGAKLEVSGTVLSNSGSNGYDAFRVNDEGMGGNPRIRLYRASTDAGQMFLYDSSNALTATVNGSGMTYFNGGNVGIGTATPSSNLSVYQGSSILSSTTPAGLFSVRMENGDPEWGTPKINYALMLEDRAGGVNSGAALGFQSGNGIGASVSYHSAAAGSGGRLEFNTSPDNSALNTQMIIDNNGNVGIGTSTPLSPLHVFDATNISPSATGAGQFSVTGNGYTGYTTLDGTGMYIGHNSATRSLTLQTNTADRLTISAAGNVGIGTSPTSSVRLLSFDSSTNASYTSGSFRASGTTTANGTYYNLGSIGLATKKVASGITDGGYSTGLWGQAFRNSGTTADSGTLALLYGELVQYGHYNSDAAATPLTTDAYGIRISPYATTGTITNMYDLYMDAPSLGGTVTNRWGLYQASASTKNYFAGAVGIGTATPSQKLDVEGNVRIGTESAANANLLIDRPAGQNGFIKYQTAGSNRWDLSATSTTESGSNAGSNFVIERYDDSGTFIDRALTILRSSGNVGIGTTAPTATLDVNGTIKATGFSGPMTPTSSAVGAGTNGAPSMTFSGDTDTGFYDTSSNNTISVGVGGSKIFDFTSTGLVSPTAGGASVATGLGTTGAPTFSFTGDTDTGWWHPAADTLAASTGGIERIRIDSAGNVGIGTSNPNGKLDVRGILAGGLGAQTTSGVLDWNDVSNARAGQGTSLLFGDATNGPTSIPSAYYHPLNFEYASKDGTGSITQFAIPYSSTTSLNSGIYMRGRYTGAWTGWMKVLSENSSGNVGIGTVSPLTSLQVGPGQTSTFFDGAQNSITPQIISSRTSGTSSLGVVVHDGVHNGRAALYMNETAGIWGLSYGYSTGANYPFVLALGGGEKMRVTGSGNVGIGTSSPGTLLHMNSSNATPTTLTVSNTSGNSTGYAQANFTTDATGFAGIWRNSVAQTGYAGSGSLNIGGGSGSTDSLGLVTANVLRLKIDSSGSVGIGTSNPTYNFSTTKLDVFSSDSNVSKLTVENSTTTSTDRYPGMILANYMGSTTFGGFPVLQFYNARGSMSSPVVPSSGDNLGQIEFHGISGSGGSFIRSSATQTWTSGSAEGANLAFYTTPNASSVPALRVLVDQSGNVGIGTTNPTYALEVAPSSATGTVSLTRNPSSADGSYAGFMLQNDNGMNNYSQFMTYSSGSIGNLLGVSRADRTFLFSTGSSSNGLAMGTVTADPLILSTTNLERMRIDSNGNVGIGTTAPTATLDVNGMVSVKASVEGAATAVNSSTSYTIPDVAKNVRRITLTGNATITLPATTTIPTDATYSLTVRVTQDGTGNRTLAWAGGANTVTWEGAANPPPSLPANKTTIYQFIFIGGESTWYASQVWFQN